MKRQIFYWAIVLLVVESLSMVTVFDPMISSVLAVTVALLMFGVSIVRPEVALSALILEFLVGSKGAFFKLGADAQADGGHSLRVLMFVAFILGWLIWSLRFKTWKTWPTHLKGRRIYFWLAVGVIHAILIGWWNGNVFLWADANAWVVWVLLLPALDLAQNRREKLKQVLYPAILVGLFWLPMKTLELLYDFSHGWFSVGGPVYLWIRRTGVGEITAMGEGAYRIFLQSQIYAIPVVIAVIAWLSFSRDQRLPRWAKGLFVLSFAEVIASLSRSFWIGLAAGLLFLGINLLRRKTWPPVQNIKILLGGSGLGVCLVIATVLFPWPAIQPAALWQMFAGRVQTNEAAGVSRWQLLPVLWQKIQEHPLRGSGFGATVTYQSQDPRAVQMTGGKVTTYAFEWGWLDQWIKFGVFGVLLLCGLLGSLLRRVWLSQLPEWMKVAIVTSVVSLAVIHIFTPYINHPLGILLIVLGEMCLLLYQRPPEALAKGG